MSVSNYVLGSLTSAVMDDIQAVTGLHLPAKPRGTVPSLPEDITELGDEDLMVLFTDLTAWSDYASSQHAVSAIEEREQQRLVDIKKAKFMSVAGSGSVSEAKAKAESEAEEEGIEVVSRYAYRKVLESIASNFERDISLVSRELSRRLGDKGQMVSRKSRFTP